MHGRGGVAQGRVEGARHGRGRVGAELEGRADCVDGERGGLAVLVQADRHLVRARLAGGQAEAAAQAQRGDEAPAQVQEADDLGRRQGNRRHARRDEDVVDPLDRQAEQRLADIDREEVVGGAGVDAVGGGAAGVGGGSLQRNCPDAVGARGTIGA